MRKRCLSILLTFVMILSTIPINLFAVEDNDKNIFENNLNSKDSLVEPDIPRDTDAGELSEENKKTLEEDVKLDMTPPVWKKVIYF